MAGSRSLLFTSSISNPLLAAVIVGMWAKVAFPGLSSWLGKGGGGAGRQSRSSTYPQAFLVNLPRRAIAEVLVPALLIVKAEPGAYSGFGLGDRLPQEKRTTVTLAPLPRERVRSGVVSQPWHRFCAN
jgi:hypothetical protein